MTPLSARAIFIAGCQRSGTTMLGQLLGLSPLVRVYHEADPRAFHKFRLREPEVLREILASADTPFVVFKSICDSQMIDHRLTDHPGASAVWIYRRFRDVVASAVHKWGDHQASIMARVCSGDWERLRWRVERLDASDLTALRAAHDGPLTAESGAALFWYLRTRLFLKLTLAGDPRVAIIRYETLVETPREELRRLTNLLHLPALPGAKKFVRRDSVAKGKDITVDPKLTAACEELQARLDAVHQAQAA